MLVKRKQCAVKGKGFTINKDSSGVERTKSNSILSRVVTKVPELDSKSKEILQSLKIGGGIKRF